MRIPDSFVPGAAARPSGRGDYGAPQVDPMNVDAGEGIQIAGRHLSAAGAALAHQGRQEQDHYDTAIVKMSAADLTETALKLDAEFKQLRGVEAQEAFKAGDGLKALRDKADTLTSKLQNDRQRRMFAIQSKLQLIETEDSMRKHYGNEAKSAAFTAAGARAETSKTARTFAFLNGDTEAANGHETALKDEVRAMGQLAGAPQEVIDSNVLKAVSSMHMDAVEGLLNQGQGSLARGYLEYAKTNGEVTEADFLRWDGATRRAGAAEEGYNLSLKVRDELQSKPRPNETPQEQEARAVNTVEDEYRAGRITYDVAQAAFGHIRTAYGQDAQTKAAADASTMDQTRQWFVQPENQRKTWEQFQNENPVLADKVIAAGGLADMKAFLANGNRVPTDWDTRIKVEGMSPAELAGMSVESLNAQFGGKLSARDFEVMLARRAQGMGKASSEQLFLTTKADLSRSTFTRMWEKMEGVREGYLSTAPDNKRREFERQFDEWRIRFDEELLKPWQEKHGAATRDDLQNLLRTAEIDEVIIGVGTFSSGRTVPLMLVPEDVKKSDDVYVRGPSGLERLNSMPDLWEMRTPDGKIEVGSPSQIARVLQQNGVPATSQAIFAEWLKLGRPGAKKPPAAPAPASEPSKGGPPRTADPLRFGGR